MPCIKKTCSYLAATLAVCLCFPQLLFGETPDSILSDKDTLIKAANIYQYRCAQCHGNWGLGDGNMSTIHRRKINTNLTQLKHLDNLNDSKKLKDIITHSFVKDKYMSKSMPPWKNELSPNEIGLLINFLPALLQNRKSLEKIIYQPSNAVTPNTRHGKNTFMGKCALCHGATGKGDGKLSKFITSPPPFDLTKSALSKQSLAGIINNGGEYYQRSPKMPAWKNELTHYDLESLILYIQKLKQLERDTK